MRPSGRQANEIRRVCFTPDFTRHAEGSVLAEFGDTRVLCTASVEDRVPPWLRGKNSGWVTGEYGMLPRSTHTRSAREAARGKQSGTHPGNIPTDRALAAFRHRPQRHSVNAP